MALIDESGRRQATREILLQCGAILQNDHFVYVNGQHGSGWIDKDAIFLHPQLAERLGAMLADAVRHLNADALCGPATGGLIVAQWTARALNLPAVFAEHDAPRGSELRGPFALHRGYDRFVQGKRVLVVDDVVSSGHSIRQTAEAVRLAGGEVVGAAALVHRGNVDAQGMNVNDFVYLLEVDIPQWPAADCPLCAQHVPVNTHHAHGQDFLDQQQRR